jgi:hypothetical protein
MFDHETVIDECSPDSDDESARATTSKPVCRSRGGRAASKSIRTSVKASMCVRANATSNATATDDVAGRGGGKNVGVTSKELVVELADMVSSVATSSVKQQRTAMKPKVAMLGPENIGNLSNVTTSGGSTHAKAIVVSKGVSPDTIIPQSTGKPVTTTPSDSTADMDVDSGLTTSATIVSECSGAIVPSSSNDVGSNGVRRKVAKRSIYELSAAVALSRPRLKKPPMSVPPLKELVQLFQVAWTPLKVHGEHFVDEVEPDAEHELVMAYGGGTMLKVVEL